MYQIINSDVYAGLSSLKDNSLDVAITSPPYWGQRDYGFEGQIGNEATFQEYILKLVKIFNVLKQKMKNDGVFFLNIGDKYLSKYGKSSLAMIPYELTFSLLQNGWILNDIIIWYKPNHMPSSVRNRFTNSYEPVFVFSKSQNNIFTNKRKNNIYYSNVLRVNLQPTPFKHVAVYPEKLVQKLLETVELKENATVIDPFAGSGTTLKVVIDNYKSCNAIMIESNDKYIDIIKQRSNLNGEVEIVKVDYYAYYSPPIVEKRQITLFEKGIYDSTGKVERKGFIKIFDDRDKYYSFLRCFENRILKLKLEKNATCFLGCKDFDIELIHRTSQLNNLGWVIRNMLVVENGNSWFPIFMIVDDNKKVDYVFKYKNLNLKSKSEYNRDWSQSSFIGLKVLDSVSKNRRNGVVTDVLERIKNGFPQYVIVEWDNGLHTKEFVVFSEEEINRNVVIKIHNENFVIRERDEIVSLNKEFRLKRNTTLRKIQNNNGDYNGKFKEEKRINWGASPGARASVEEEYFSLQRLYEVDQNIIVDYLNHKRIEKGLSKSEITNLFPSNYKHTVGHWLRKDFGGSLPTPEDWKKLSEILEIDNNITNYVCKTALRLQTVKHAEYKMPDDFISSSFVRSLKTLIE